jgi:hypothetical protein
LRDFLLDGFDPGDSTRSMLHSHVSDKVGSFLGGDLDIMLLYPATDIDDPDNPWDRDAAELMYTNQPIEIIPFSWNGGDGLHYGWAVLAPELDPDDHPCVSFAPVDESACWLGDQTGQALENLLVGAVANWEEWHREQGYPSPADDPRWATLCRALDLHPEVGSPDITAGARSKHAIRPTVPPGWRYEPTGDGIGVLADASAFAPHQEAAGWDRDTNLAQARRYLADGYPASALCMLKDTYSDREVMQTMRKAYQALGRALHVERTDIWLRHHE